MKRLLTVFVLIAFTYQLISQTISDKERISLSVWIPDNITGLPSVAKQNLENKLMQIVTNNGLGADAENSQFIVTANVNILTKDITPTAPVMHAYTLNITIYIGDGFEGIAYSNYSLTVKGVGENETKAYLAALKNIPVNNKEYSTFIDKAKKKILAYYETKCDKIIKEAEVLAIQNRYDEAIWRLTSVPDVCSDCWKKCMDAVAPIYKSKINTECKQKLNTAINIWNAGMNYQSAERVAEILADINPNASCMDEIEKFTSSISKRIYEIDKREWEFKVDSEIGLQKDMIQAYRDIGVAYGNNQPQNITYKTFW